MVNENIALAKSILNKLEIDNSSDDYKDYLAIRELVGTNFGFVGILTRLRFIDDVTDLDELKSIFEVLKSSRIDVSTISKMSYKDILSKFYNELILTSSKDYELIFSDEKFHYYKVYTYEGILELGSPAWCLKTKKNWDAYFNKYGNQWVVIHKAYTNRLISPKNNYLKYQNTDRTWIRFGVSITNLRSDGSYIFEGFDDNNNDMQFKMSYHIHFGVVATIRNLMSGRKESYMNYIHGTTNVGYGKFIIDNPKNGFNDFNNGDEVFKKTYAYIPECYGEKISILIANNTHPYVRQFSSELEYDINIDFFRDTIYEISRNPINASYAGIRVKLGYKVKEDYNKHILAEKDGWAVFAWNEHLYIVVNLEIDEFIIPVTTNSTTDYLIDEKRASYYFISIKNKKGYEGCNFEETKYLLSVLFPKKFLGLF